MADKIKNFIACLFFGGFLLSIETANSSGFVIIDQSVSSMGGAYSGISVLAEDASTVYFNPAGMSKLKGSFFSGGAHLIMPRINFHSKGGSLTGGDGGNAGKIALVPDFYFVTPINNKIHFGFAINSPFGLSGEYDKDWKGRYHALKSSMLTVNLNPAISYSFNDKLSVALGFNAQYVDLEVTNAIDFGTVCQQAISSAFCNDVGLTPQSADGHFKGKGDDWGFGFNVGILFEPIDGTRIGATYRSNINISLKGAARFKVPIKAAFLTSGGAFTNTGLKGKLDLPETVSVGIFQQLNEYLDIMADLSWTRWERFEEFSTDFDNPNQPDENQPQKWKNTFRYSLGLNYHYNSDWVLRLGVAYDESPITHAKFRTPRIPDANRYWFTIGTGYQFNSSLSFDVAYIHLFIQDAKINSKSSLGHILKGVYKEDDNTVSAQLNWKF